MIRFFYALGHEELTDAAVFTAAGFSGVEQGGVGFASDGFVPVYRIVPPQQPGTSPVAIGALLREEADIHHDVELHLSNGGAFVSPRELWQVLEAAHHPRVKIAWNAAIGRETGRTAAMVVPTLNLRLGLVRVDQLDDETLAYTKRLAGIGFAGVIVVDPPAVEGQDRLTISKEIAAAALAAIAPKKPAKAPAKPVAKPVAAKAVAE